MSTKKMKILIGVLIAALLVGTGAYIAVDTLKSREEQAAYEEAKALQLFDFDENSIDKVELSFSEGSFIVEKATGGWTITDTDYQYSLDLNAFYINTICTYLSDLTALKKLNISSSELSSYGLDNAQPLTCYSGNTAYTIYLGNPSATEEYFYIMLPDDSAVYAVDFNEGEILKGGLSYLRDPYMIPWMDVNITYVKLDRQGKTAFEIEKDENNRWQMSAPLHNADLNAANINSMLTSVTRLQIENFLQRVDSPQDLIDYHLDDPAYQFTIKTDSGEMLTIDFADFDTADNNVYLVYEESGQIASMTVNSVSFLQTQPSELMLDKLYSPEYTQVASLDVQVDDLHFTMNMNHDENQYILIQTDGAETDISTMNESVPKTFRALFQSVSNMTYDSLDLDAELAGEAEPSAIFHYTLTDGSEHEVTLIPVDDTFYQAFLDGEYTGKIVRRRALSGNNGVLTYYEKLLDEIELNAE